MALQLVRSVPIHGCWVVTPAGNMPARDDLHDPKKVPTRLRAMMLVTMNRHIQGVSRPKAVKSLRNDIWEFRAQDQGICLRVLYFTDSPHCVGAHTFVKKERVTSTADVNQARRAKNSWSLATCGGSDW